MKFTILSGDDRKATRQRTQEVSAFFEYIKEDHNQWLISMFRNDLPRLEHPEYYIRYRKIAHVLPAVELRKQENGALVMQAYNGLVVLEVSPLRGDEALRSAKELAASWPTTLAAFVGADGQTLVVLVRVALRDGSLPAAEGEAEAFYEAAFQQVLPIYTQVLQDYPIVAQSGGLRHEVLMPLDAAPYMDLHAACIKVSPQPSAAQEADAYDDLPAPRHRQKDEDWDAHAIYERIYGEAARRAHATTGISPRDPLNPTLLTALAHEMCEQQVPQEEAFTHIWQHVMFRDVAQEDVVRSIVDATYDDELPDQHPVLGTPRREGDELRELIRRLEQRYAFRHNNIMGCTEFRRNVSGPAPWTPMDRSIVSDLTIEMRLADIHVSEKDVWQYVMGRRRIPQYNPVGEFLYECRGKWDGKDHIRALARTVPTDTPQWADWFHTWFLAMVAQWTGRNLRFGNSLVPLLISRQGFHKSDFCRQLLPRDLRSWGFTDSLNLGEEKTVMLAMGQTLLINLDEFNSISPRKQEGFLKNIIQLPIRPCHRGCAASGVVHRHDQPVRCAQRPRRFPTIHRRARDGGYRHASAAQLRTAVRPGHGGTGQPRPLLVGRRGDDAAHGAQPPVPAAVLGADILLGLLHDSRERGGGRCHLDVQLGSSGRSEAQGRSILAATQREQIQP